MIKKVEEDTGSAPDAAAETAPETETETEPETETVLRIVNADATPEEVAAIVAVFSALQGAPAPPSRPRPAWSAHHRKVRTTHPHGFGGWRSSALPR